ncbi:MAG TPA: hypothetical protein VGE74_11600 [Gemmata sp.]
MTRFFTTAARLLVTASVGLARDMPLSQIVIPGEGWKKVASPGARPTAPRPNPLTTLSADRGTAFIAARERLLWAAPVGSQGSVVASSAPYAPIRQKPGATQPTEVTGLAADRNGRIYAATEIGVQVFDPTGRMCGVLTPAAAGVPNHLAFEGDTLTLWIGNTKYAKELNTGGAK